MSPARSSRRLRTHRVAAFLLVAATLASAVPPVAMPLAAAATSDAPELPRALDELLPDVIEAPDVQGDLADLQAKLSAERARQDARPAHGPRVPVDVERPAGEAKPPTRTPLPAPEASRSKTKDAPLPLAGAAGPETSFAADSYAGKPASFTAKRFVVGFASTPKDLAVGSSWNGDAVVEVVDALALAVLEPADGDVAAAVERARARAGVEYAEPDAETTWISDVLVPDDARYQDQYAPAQVSLPLAWPTTTGGDASAICILDTGVRFTHEDLAGARYLGGYDFINGDADPMDDNGHGTHVAGIAAATIGNALGVAGAANVGYYAVKVLDASGSGAFSTIAQGIQWCADNTMPNTVLSLSLGSPFGSVAVRRAVEHAVAQGKLIVAAAGNAGPCDPCVGYPAAYEQVVAVACTEKGRATCSFSSAGPEVEISAPGQLILSTWNTANDAYASISGTSMSTPLVSGIAALVWGNEPSLTATQLRARLATTARDLGAPGRDSATGFGEVDAYCAINAMTECAPPDILPPGLLTAIATDSGRVTLKFDEVLDASSVPEGSAFTLTLGETTLSIGGVSIDGDALALDLAAALARGDVVVVSYAPGATPLRDPAGNPVGAFGPVGVDTSGLVDPALEEGTDGLYSFVTSRVEGGPAFNFIDISSDARALRLGDDDWSQPIELPFAFTAYGVRAHDVVVGSNGYLMFDRDLSNDYDGDSIPSSELPPLTLAGLWTDLDASEGGRVLYSTVGAPGSRIFIVQWDDVPYYSSDDRVTFQIQLHEATGAAEVHYLSVPEDADDRNPAAIGVQRDATTGLTYQQGFLELHDLAIRFSDLATVPCAVGIGTTQREPFPTDTVALTPLANGAEATASWIVNGVAVGSPPTTFAPGETFVRADVACPEGGFAVAHRRILGVEPDTMPFPIAEAMPAFVDGRLLILGGRDTDQRALSASVFEYDEAARRVRELDWSLPAPRAGSATLVIDGAVWLFGGYGTESGYDYDALGHQYLRRDVMRVDPATGAVTTFPTDAYLGYGLRAVHDPRVTPECPAGCAYLIGVQNDAGRLDVGRFSLQDGSLTLLGLYPPVGPKSAASLVDGLVVMMGGDASDLRPDGIVTFDPLTGELRASRSVMPVPVDDAFGFSDGTYAYSVGGYAWDDETAAPIVRYDPARDVVEILAPEDASDGIVPGVAVDGTRIFLVGGYTSDWWETGRIAIIDLDGAPLAAPPDARVLDYDMTDPWCNGGVAPASPTDPVCDRSPADNDGAFAGGMDASAWNGAAFAFDGVDDAIVSDTTFWGGDAQAVTIEATFRTTVAGGKIIGFQSADATRYDRQLFLDSSGRLHFGVVDGSLRELVGERDLADGEWHTATAILYPSKSWGGIALFVDGVLVDADESYGAEYVSGQWRLGEGNLTGWSSSDGTFQGEIARARVSHRAIAWSEIAPALRGAEARPEDEAAILARFTKPLDDATLPAAGAFSVDVAGLPATVTGVALVGDDTLRLALAAPLAFGQVVGLSYAPGDAPLRDVFGMPVPAFDAPVANLLLDLGLETLGPDAFGYTAVSSHAPDGPTGGLLDMSAASTLPLFLPDGMSHALDLGFDVDFYGTSYRTVHVSAEGYLVFSRPFDRMPCSGGAMPLAGAPYPMVAGMWSDWSPAYFGGSESGQIRYDTLGTAPERVFVVEWANVRQRDSSATATFQIQIFEDGRIRVAYPDTQLAYGGVEDACTTTIGIQSVGGLSGLTYRYGAERLPASTIEFRPPASPIGFTFEPARPVAGEDVTFTATGVADGLPVAWTITGTPAPIPEAAAASSLVGETSVTQAFPSPEAFMGDHFVTLTIGEGEAARSVTRLVRVVDRDALPWTTYLTSAAPTPAGGVIAPNLLNVGSTMLTREFGDIAGVMGVYDPSNGAFRYAEAEVPFIHYLPLTLEGPGGQVVVMDVDLEAALTLGIARGRVLVYDAVEDRFLASTPTTVAPYATLGAGFVDPRPTPACPAGCAYLALGFDMRGSSGLFLDIQEVDLATGAVRDTDRFLPEGIIYGGAAFARGGRFFGGVDAENRVTNATIAYHRGSDTFSILPREVDMQPYSGMLVPGVFRAGRMLGIATGAVVDDASNTAFLRDVRLVDPTTGASVALGELPYGFLLSPTYYDGGALHVLGGIKVNDLTGSSSELSFTAHHFDMPPMMERLEVRGGHVLLGYTEPIDPDQLPAPSDFTVLVDGAPVAVLSVTPGAAGASALSSHAPDSLDLTLSQTVAHGQDVQVSYAPGASGVQDANGNPAPGFSGVGADNVAPPAAALAPSTPNGLGGWYVTAPTFTMSGEGQLQYCVTTLATCVPSTPYVGPVTLPEGALVVRYQSVIDDVPTDAGQLVANVDLTPPVATPGGDSGALAGTAATITFAFSEAMDRATTEAALAGAAGWSLLWNAESTLLTATKLDLAPGTHTLTLGASALDAHGRALAGAVSRSVTAPAPPAPAPTPAGTPGAPVGLSAAADAGRVILSWSPPASGPAPTGYAVSRSANGQPWVSLGTVSGSPFTDNGVSPGASYQYSVVSLNAAGAGEGATASVTVPALVLSSAIDVSPATPDGANGWYTAAPVVTLTPQPATATIRYGWNEAADTDYSAPLTPPDGESTLTWHARAAGAADEAPRTRSFKVDPRDPVVSASISAASIAVESPVTISASASDSHSGVASVVARVTGPAGGVDVPLAGTGAYAGSFTPTTPGAYTVVVTARDRAGRAFTTSALSLTVAEPEDLEPTSETDGEEPTETTPTLTTTTTPTLPPADPLGAAGASGSGTGGSGGSGGSSGGASPPPPRVVAQEEADGNVTIRLENVPNVGKSFIVIIATDGTETILASGAQSARWDTTGYPDGYYTVETRERRSDGSTFTIASTTVLVRHPEVSAGQAVGAIATGVGAVVVSTALSAFGSAAASAGGGAAASAATSAATTAATSTVTTQAVGAGASRGFDLFGYLRELFTDAGSDALRDRTRNLADIERRRRISGIVVVTLSAILLAVFFTYADVQTWTWSDFVQALPIFGGAAVIVGLAKLATESVISRATGLRPQFKLWVAGIASLAASAMFFGSPFGYPGYVDRQGPERPTKEQRRIVGLQGLAIVGVTIAWALPFLVIGRFLHFDFGDVGVAMVMTAVATSAMPLGPLPGKEVWQWNKPLALGLAALGFLLYLGYTLVLLPNSAILALGLVGLATYAYIFAKLRKTPMSASRTVPVSVNVPVKDASEEEGATKDAKDATKARKP